MSHHTLSLWSAVFINVNIMLGSGIFINTTILAQKTGFFGAFCYLIVGLLMFPLILSISRLLSIHPSGGFYTFGSQEIHPFAGFVSAWSYATGKLASAVIICQIAVLLLQKTIPLLALYDPLILNASIIILFIMLNMLDIRTGSSIQYFFLLFKLIPILFAILTGIYFFSPSHIPIEGSLTSIPFTLPLVLFAMVGFEAACSLSSRIQNAHINGPRAIFISYGFVVAATFLFQLSLYCKLGTLLGSLPDFRAVFPALFTHLLPTHPLIAHQLTILMHLAIAASALGGSYGIIFSNMWNLYTLAEHKHLVGSHALVQFNRFNIPWLCVLIEAVIYLLFLYVSQGSQIPLQQLGAMGPIIAYSISVIALFLAIKRGKTKQSLWIPFCGLISCALLFGCTVYSLWAYEAFSLQLFGALIAIGSIMFWATK